jgi:hypothetical protein
VANSLLQRYIKGEHCEVWRDLVALGAAVRSDQHYKDAVEVAAETMKRARQNVESIIVRLEKLGYEFTSREPEPPITATMGGVPMEMSLSQMTAGLRKSTVAQPEFEPRNAHEQSMAQMTRQMGLLANTAARLQQADEMRAAEERQRNAAQHPLNNPDVFAPAEKNAGAELDRFEKDIGGPLPISLRQLYQQVGLVNPMGRHEALNPPFAPHSPDPLVIFPYRRSAEGDYGPDLSERDTDVLELALAPDALHKAHASGGDAYSMRIPDPAADGLFLWEPHKTTFVDYLRLVFAWGGFPGWEGVDGRPRKELDVLREGLLAV